MKTGIAISIAALGCLLHHARADEDSPKHTPSKHSTQASSKNADSDDDDPKPKKHVAKKKAADSDDDDAKPQKKPSKSDADGSKKDDDSKLQKKGDKSDADSSKKDGDTADKPPVGAPQKKDNKDGKGEDPANLDKSPVVHPAVVSSIRSDELLGFDEYPADIQALIESGLALTHQKLTYLFGGSSPSEGGMDCSGTINYVLTQHGVKNVPRSSDEICQWVREHSGLHLAPDGVELSNDAFSALRPGDLLFWTGTYETLPRKLPVSHIMMYLGVMKKTGKPVVFGSSDGRSYAGERLCGVSVFDFNMPRTGGKAAFFGYGTIPGLSKARAHEEVRKAETTPAHEVAMVDQGVKKGPVEEPVEEDAHAPKKAPVKADSDTDRPHSKKVPATESAPPKPMVKSEPANDTPPKVKPKAVVKNDDEAKPEAKTKVTEDKPAVKDDGDAKPKALAKSDDAEKKPAVTDDSKPKPKEDADDADEPKKATPHKAQPTPKKKSTSSNSTAKRKADDDTIDPARAVKKVVNTIKRAFD